VINKTRIIQNYLLFSLPFVIICMIWNTISPEKEILLNPTIFTKFVWEILSWNLMLWFAVLILFLVMLVIVPTTRESTLTRLANIKERDEREEYITGRASRVAYISTLSVMLLFLFISIFTINIYRAPESEAVNGKRGNVSIGLSLNLLDEPKVESNTSGEVIFESNDIPLSKSAIILILIAWQLLAFNISARRQS
jgi:hypothetical protein